MTVKLQENTKIFNNTNKQKSSLQLVVAKVPPNIFATSYIKKIKISSHQLHLGLSFDYAILTHEYALECFLFFIIDFVNRGFTPQNTSEIKTEQTWITNG